MLKTQAVSEKKIVQTPSETGKVSTKPPGQKPQEEEILEVYEEGGGIKKGSFLSNLLVRAAILAFVNLVGIAGIFYFDQGISEKARGVKEQRSEQQTIFAQNLEVIKRNVAEHSEKAEKVLALFANDDELVIFANELDRIKKEGKVTGFSFVAESAVKDKTGSIGIPVLIEIKGTWEEIDSDLQKIQKMPFLLRAIEVEAKPGEEEGLIDFRFGGFLYVGKEFKKN